MRIQTLDSIEPGAGHLYPGHCRIMGDLIRRQAEVCKYCNICAIRKFNG